MSQVMNQESFLVNSNAAVLTLMELGKKGKAPKMSDVEAFRDAYAKEVAERYGNVVSPAQVLVRWAQLKNKGGFIQIPAGIKGRRVDKVAIKNEVANTCANLDKAGIKYTVDEKGNIVIG